jgi:predicted dehydrogenase
MNHKLRFAIVGCGVIHGTHIDAIKTLGDDAELVAVCDEVRAAADTTAQTHGVSAFYDLDTMLKQAEFDVLNVCTPSGLHALHGVAGANAGKHVVCEKPIDISLRAADELIAACRKNNVKLEVISQTRYAEGIQELHRYLDGGRLGDLCYGEVTIKWYRTQGYYDSGGWRGTWALDGGGALMNQGVHYADQLRWAMGPVKSLSATMATRAHERIEVEDVVTASIEFTSGAVGTLTASTACYPGYAATIEIYGTKGSVRLESNKIQHVQFVDEGEEVGAYGGTVTRATSSSDPSPAADPKAITTSGHVRQFQDLIEAVRTGRDTEINGEQGRNALELVLGVYESARNGGKRVHFPL